MNIRSGSAAYGHLAVLLSSTQFVEKLSLARLLSKIFQNRNIPHMQDEDRIQMLFGLPVRVHSSSTGTSVDLCRLNWAGHSAGV